MGSIMCHVHFCISGVHLWHSHGMAAFLLSWNGCIPTTRGYTSAWGSLNGLLPSTCWPTMVFVTGNRFGKAGRGVVFSLWSASASVDYILGACLASSVPQYCYEYAFLVMLAVQFAGGTIIFFGLLVSPEEINLPGIETEENSEEDLHRP